MSNKNLKIIFFGLGSIGQRHLQNISKLFSNLELYSFKKNTNNFLIKDGKKNNKIDIFKKYKIKKISSLTKLKSIKFDYAFICNPSSLHIKYAIQLAKLGINLFIEKPLSNSMKDVKKLKDIIKKKNIKCMLGFNLRYNECYKFIKKKLANKNFFGKIYKVDLFNGEFLPNYHPYEDYRKSYASRKNLGGGVILTQIHELDLILSLFGEPKKIFSHCDKISNLEIDVEDNVDVLMIMKNKIILNLHLDYITNPSIRYLRIYGFKKNLYWDYYKNCIEIFDKKKMKLKKISFKKLKRNLMFEEEIKDFINSKSSDSNFPNIETGIETLKLAIAIKRGHLN
jgi:predicted dehydrogenase